MTEDGVAPAFTAAATTPATAKASLRSRLQRRVLVPLALTWLLGSTMAAAVAYVFTQRAFDRSLLDDAYAIAAQVTETADGEVALNLSPREIGAVLFDQTERVFFALRRADGLLVAGHAGLPVMNFDKGQPWEFGDHHFRGLDLRVVALRRSTPRPFVVVVGQTVLTRSEVLKRLLALAVVPQALLLLLLGLWLRHSISDELQPLAQLQLALESRDSSDLSPVHVPVHVPAPSRDVARLGDAANGLMARIAAGVQSQREFAGNVAHELRTPLAGIRSLAEYGLAHNEPAVWREQLQRIQQSEQRASHLVDQLLALARADESRDGLQLQPLQVDTLVHELLLRTLPRADAEGVDLGAVGLEQPSWALGSVALLEGLLGNLLDNALRYGRPADPTQRPRVTVEVAAEAAEVVLSVTDNGPGLAAGGAPPQRVLARWMRGDAGEQHGRSAGLGLAIVARYAALLGASFALLPAAEGPGLCAQVRLKAAVPPSMG